MLKCWILPGDFSVSNVQSRTAIYAAIIPSLLYAEKYISGTNKWRLQRSLLQSFSQFQVPFPQIVSLPTVNISLQLMLYLERSRDIGLIGY